LILKMLMKISKESLMKYINVDMNAEFGFDCVNSNSSIFSGFMFEDFKKI